MKNPSVGGVKTTREGRLFVSNATAHGRSWEPCGFRKQRARAPSPFGEFSGPSSVSGATLERETQQDEERGGKGELFRVCCLSFLVPGDE